MRTKNQWKKGLKMIRPRKAIEKMKPYNPPLEGRRGLIRLDFNENTVGCSPNVLEAMRKISADEIATYPEYSKFKRKLANYLGIKEDELMVNNATDESIMVIMQTYIEKGDEVILPVPTFAMFRFYAQLMEAKLNEILYNKDLSFPTDKVLSSISKKTKLVILCNPNNPTGTPIKKEDVIKIIQKAEANSSLVLLDEAYVQYNKSTCIDLIDKYKNLVIIQTFSKAYGMAGLRLGYAIADKEIMKNLLKAASPYSVNTMATAAGSAAIDDQEFVKNYVKEVEKSKKIIYRELKKLGIKAYPTAANFLVAYFGKNAKRIADELKKNGVLVRDRSNYPLLKGCLRIGIGTMEQTNQLIKALKVLL